MNKIMLTVVICAVILMTGCEESTDEPIFAACPAGEVTVATPNGTLTWAGSNLSAAGEFATNPWRFGYYFSWVDAKSACPSGWRLPTALELGWLINANWEDDKVYGVADGAYTGPNTWVSGSFETGGFNVISKRTTHTIQFPNAGGRTSGSGSTATYDAGTSGLYWSSDATGSDAYGLDFTSGRSVGYLNTGSQTLGLSVRCVR